MALSIGTVKQVSGLVMVRNEQGNEKTLKVGDIVHFADSIRTIGAGSHIVLGLNDGQEIVLNGNDNIFIDKSVYVSEAFGNEAVVAGQTMDNVISGKSVEEVQAALLAGKDINDLEATAAGEGGAPIGGEMSTNATARYIVGGNESNVTADYRTLDGAGASDVNYVAPTATPTTPSDTTASATIEILPYDITPDDVINFTESQGMIAIAGVVGGDAKAGDTITIQDHLGTIIGTGQVNPDGTTFSIDVAGSALLSGNTISATVVGNDPSGNFYTDTDDEGYSVDTQASATIEILPYDITPDDVINFTESQGMIAITGVVGGDAKAGDTITIQDHLGTIIGTGQVNPDGTTFSIDVAGSALLSGNTISATVVGNDPSGNFYTDTDDEGYSVDTQASATIEILPYDITPDDVINFTESQGMIAIAGVVGGDAKAGDTITIQDHLGTIIGTGQVNPDGTSFSIDVAGSALLSGNTISATVVGNDPSGNFYTDTDDEGYSVDTNASATIEILPYDITPDDVINFTESQGMIAITGVVGGDAKAGDTITIQDHLGTIIGTGQVNPDGTTFSIDVAGSALLSGNTISATVVGNDPSGNFYTDTDDEGYSVDTNASATIEILPYDITPDDVINFTESQGMIAIAGVVGGDAKAGDTITIQDHLGTIIGTGQVNPDGTTFSIDVAGSALLSGNTISATVVGNDPSGNFYTDTDDEGYDRAPVAVDDAITVVEDTVYTSAIDLDANDTDLDGDSLSVQAGTFTTSAGGTIVIASDGSYTYTPPSNYNGADSVDYTLSDGKGTDVGTLNINILAVADAPVLSVSIPEGDVSFNDVLQTYTFTGNLNSGTTTGNLTLNGYADKIDVIIRSYKTSVDDGQIVFLRDGAVIKTVSLDSLLPDQNNQTATLHVNADGQLFDAVRIDNIGADSNAEFKIDSVSLVASLLVTYVMNIDASGESLGDVLIAQSTMPTDATLFENGVVQTATDGYYAVDPDNSVTFTTTHILDVDELNAISSSVTSWDGSDSSTTTTTALYEEPIGTSDDDTLFGSLGDDLIDGGAGNDTISGDDGADTLQGDSGNDTLDGGVGVDSLYGEADNDTLVYDSADSVIDGGVGIDTLLIKDATIDFSTISDANVDNIEVLDLTQANVAMSGLNPNDVFEITDSADTILRVIGDTSDSVASTFNAGTSPWAAMSDQTGVDAGFTRYEGTLDDGVTKVMVDIQNTIVHTDFD